MTRIMGYTTTYDICLIQLQNYDESGSPRRTTCLKYLVLANMLMKSGINPFDSQEAKPYKNDPEILAMTNLVSAYQVNQKQLYNGHFGSDSLGSQILNNLYYNYHIQNNDINEFEKILKQNRQTIMDDPFIREHIEDLLRNIRTQVIKQLRFCIRLLFTKILSSTNIYK